MGRGNPAIQISEPCRPVRYGQCMRLSSLICDVVADMARYVTGENCGGEAVPVGQAIPPLPYGEKKGSKRNCFLQPEKYFFGLAVAPKLTA